MFTQSFDLEAYASKHLKAAASQKKNASIPEFTILNIGCSHKKFGRGYTLVYTCC